MADNPDQDPEEEEDDDAEVTTEKLLELTQLMEMARLYPFRWFSLYRCGQICGFGRDAMRQFAEHPEFPLLKRKTTPALFHEWATKNRGAIDKIDAEPDPQPPARPVKKLSETICRKHRWKVSRYSRQCTICGLVEDLE